MMLMSRLKWLIVPLALGLGAAGGVVATRAIMSNREESSPRRTNLDSIPPGFFDVEPLATKDESGPAPVQPGQILVIEVLEALPGRPITGERIVRPDGTISMGFYGDLSVAGLNRNQIKVKLLEHLRKYINDEVLGLMFFNRDDGTPKANPPLESNRVFVDDSIYPPKARDGDGKPATDAEASRVVKLGAQIDELSGKLESVMKELEQIRRESSPAKP